ncbi:neurophysin 1-like [Paramacrobiotus metropolitanus]|uniref:neurophysin 1-like n=1 Tax=Paramacrobiotus metropolitanus TaxID=2943436 RepID=UPI0024458A8C|nr:neurophysin 1-like [Paramacrobiotus metropolitanus]
MASLMFCGVFLCLFIMEGSFACFITNCPPGGKRSAYSFAPSPYRRQCMKCGPGGKGHCYGSNICCGESFGCLMGTEETAVCVKENYIRTPCYNQGSSCGQNDKGICAADGICCNEQGCVADQKCTGQ